MSLADLVSVSITSATVGVTAQGFGIPLILGYNAPFAERSRSYTTLATMVTDGFATTDPEYLAATALLSADTKVDSFMVGKGALPPTQVWTLAAKAVTAGAEYNLRVGADSISITAGSGTFAGNDEIIDQIYDAILAATGYATSGFTAAVTGSANSKKVTLTASTAGNYLAIEPENIDLVDVVEAEADPGIATDLAAISAYDDTWYGLVTCFKSKLIVAAAAAWVETAEKLYVVASNESAIANTVLAGATDVAAALKTSAYARTGVIYHPANDEFADAGWLGKCLPYDPGEETWAYKTLRSASPRPTGPTSWPSTPIATRRLRASTPRSSAPSQPTSTSTSCASATGSRRA
jgi:hypothetical protein